MTEYSVSPAGENFPIPAENEYEAEFKRIEDLTKAARDEGKEIVVVMGVGFVGAVMAAIVADTTDKKTAQPSKFVIGCQRPSTRSYWKIPVLNKGLAPFFISGNSTNAFFRKHLGCRGKQSNRL